MIKFANLQPPDPPTNTHTHTQTHTHIYIWCRLGRKLLKCSLQTLKHDPCSDFPLHSPKEIREPTLKSLSSLTEMRKRQPPERWHWKEVLTSRLVASGDKVWDKYRYRERDGYSLTHKVCTCMHVYMHARMQACKYVCMSWNIYMFV